MEDWLPPLQDGQSDVAWDRFLSRYRRLIFATIRHYTQDYDDLMDVFAHVCERLRADDMRRLRARGEERNARAQVSTWLVAVVRNVVIDRMRHRDGRRRLSAAAQGLPPRQRRIFELVFIERRSHMETYELLCTDDSAGLTFHQFLADLRETYRAAGEGHRGQILRQLGAAPPPPADEAPASPMEAAERAKFLEEALSGLPPGERLAVQLYVLEDLPAERVARIVGLPNAKAVYNCVYRALAALRQRLRQSGIQKGDL